MELFIFLLLWALSGIQIIESNALTPLNEIPENVEGIKIKVGGKDFTLEKKLAAGVFGTAYKGTSAKGNDVVVKVMHPDTSEKKESFKAEIKGLKKLGNLIAKDKNHFVNVQKYIKGEPLNQYMRRIQSSLKTGDREQGLKVLEDLNHKMVELGENFYKKN
jgi:serine/threonine protein kinase